MPETKLLRRGADGCIEVQVWNKGAESCVIKASKHRPTPIAAIDHLLDLHAQQIPRTVHWNLHISGNWFDFAMTLPSWHRRYADRLETGRDGVTDPALGIGMRSL